MQIELNAVELEAAVVAHLINSGLDMKKKDISFEFEGTCVINIEPETPSAPAPKKAPVKRAPKAKAKEPEPETTKPVEVEAVPVAKAAKKAKADVEDTVTKPVTDTPPTADDLFNTGADTVDEDTSLFG